MVSCRYTCDMLYTGKTGPQAIKQICCNHAPCLVGMIRGIKHLNIISNSSFPRKYSWLIAQGIWHAYNQEFII